MKNFLDKLNDVLLHILIAIFLSGCIVCGITLFYMILFNKI